MSLSSIQTNLAALINKAYSPDNSATKTDAATQASANTAASAQKEATSAADSATDNPAGASAEVTLGQSGNTTEVYTAQGLLQQMRQIQLSNTMVLFGNDEENTDDSTGLMGMFDSKGNTEDNSDLTELSQQPQNAAVMVEKAKNSSIKTMLGG